MDADLDSQMRGRPPQPVEEDALIDGGLINPLPITLCRALGAERVIAVDVNGGALDEERPLDATAEAGQGEEAVPSEPSLFEVIERSLLITQRRLTRLLVSLGPPDLLLRPNVSQIGFVDFFRGKECFEAGRRAVEEAAGELARFTTAAAVPGPSYGS